MSEQLKLKEAQLKAKIARIQQMFPNPTDQTEAAMAKAQARLREIQKQLSPKEK